MKHSIRIAARPTALLAFAAAALASAACSTTPALTLTATPDSIGGDGQSPITVTAKVTSGGAPAADGTTVHAVIGVADTRMYSVKASGRGAVRGA